MKPSDFDAAVARTAPGSEREKFILGAFASGTPSWMFDQRKWVRVPVGSRLQLLVSPDYLSIGDDADYRRVPMQPATAQAIATAHDAILPTRKLVDDIYAAGNKLASVVLPPDATMVKPERWVEHDAKIGTRSDGKLLVGHKKDIVIGPNLDGSRVAIYGWQPDPKVSPHQSYSTIHSFGHVDYSHGARLVSRWALLDGKVVDVVDIFRSPELSSLVSDQGVFVPVFPSRDAPWPASSSSNAPLWLVGLLAGGLIGGPVGAALGGLAGVIIDKK